MKKPLTERQANNIFNRKVDAYLKQKDKENRNFKNIPFGYGMRASHRLKHFSNRSGQIKAAIIKMSERHNILPYLLEKAQNAGININYG